MNPLEKLSSCFDKLGIECIIKHNYKGMGENALRIYLARWWLSFKFDHTNHFSVLFLEDDHYGYDLICNNRSVVRDRSISSTEITEMNSLGGCFDDIGINNTAYSVIGGKDYIEIKFDNIYYVRFYFDGDKRFSKLEVFRSYNKIDYLVDHYSRIKEEEEKKIKTTKTFPNAINFLEI